MLVIWIRPLGSIEPLYPIPVITQQHKYFILITPLYFSGMLCMELMLCEQKLLTCVLRALQNNQDEQLSDTNYLLIWNSVFFPLPFVISEAECVSTVCVSIAVHLCIATCCLFIITTLDSAYGYENSTGALELVLSGKTHSMCSSTCHQLAGALLLWSTVRSGIIHCVQYTDWHWSTLCSGYAHTWHNSIVTMLPHARYMIWEVSYLLLRWLRGSTVFLVSC